MYTKLDASTINQEPIENILSVLEARGELQLDTQGNSTKISLDWHFSTKYRFDRRKNLVWSFDIPMPSWKPFNFIKSFYFSDLWDKEAIAETFKWFKKYYWINDEYSWDLKMNDEYLKEINKRAEQNRIKKEKQERAMLARRKTFWISFDKLKMFYSDKVLDYFEWRWISKKTLERNNARTWVVLHNAKTYKNRLFLPSKVGANMVWIKMRNIYAKGDELKSQNMVDSWPWLLYNEEDIKWQETVYLSEGEIDKMSLDEAGIYNNVWNQMWANTFDESWFKVFEEAKTINILYDFDKNSLAWLQWVLKVMKLMPEKRIKFLDLPKLLEDNYSEDREHLLEHFTDINDLWTTHLATWKPNQEFKAVIDKNLVEKSPEEIEEIVRWFRKVHEEDKKNEIWTFSLSFKSKVKSLDDFKPLSL